MKKTREERGITLIALIITIVVLLILAVVTINQIQDNDGGIIAYAENATTEYENAQKTENDIISSYEIYLEKHNPNKKIISFTCEELTNATSTNSTSTTHTLKAEEGMTWYEWCNSKYNTVNYVCSDINSTITIKDSNGGEYLQYLGTVLGKDTIKAGATYDMFNLD